MNVERRRNQKAVFAAMEQSFEVINNHFSSKLENDDSV